ncbi:sulfurtransferase TusA family protein [Eikenella sp. Marseille-P7795]|uniref:sulfurtransferase TusA family protein n=1 Tax=Eikenella sp. Marseille-P7795 TaxID=2866577 RepID=UPI001CE41271|nr:sulfurtransferase TusA family protein [Eikenella sp. Marseille-P7795]
MTPDLQLDLTGLKCPLPILRAKKALATMQAGQILSVHATDPGAPDDFAAFCRQTGHRLLSSDTENSVFRLVIQHK